MQSVLMVTIILQFCYYITMRGCIPTLRIVERCMLHAKMCIGITIMYRYDLPQFFNAHTELVS